MGRERSSHSATSAGLDPPSTSTVASRVIEIPFSMASTTWSVNLPRRRLPARTGAGKRTRLSP